MKTIIMNSVANDLGKLNKYEWKTDNVNLSGLFIVPSYPQNTLTDIAERTSACSAHSCTTFKEGVPI